jgi:hypothetical protein
MHSLVAAKSASNASTQEKSRPKRKIPSSKPLNGDAGTEDETDELDDDQATQPAKKRRTSKVFVSGGDRKSYIEKSLKELDAQIARLAAAQADANREMKKLQERFAALAAVVQESDED